MLSHEPPQRSAGFSIVEVMVALLLIVGLVSLIQGGMVSVHTANQRGETQLSVDRRARDVLDVVCEDLQRCSLDPDPVTGALRYDFGEVVDGNPVAVFRMLEGTELQGTELAQRWSSDVRVECRSDGSVVRIQDGSAVTAGLGIASITYQVEPAHIIVTVVAQGDSRGGVSDTIATRTVRPFN